MTVKLKQQSGKVNRKPSGLSNGTSRVSITRGYKKSLNYQTVSVDVYVEVPVETGKEQEGLKYAAKQANQWLAESEEDVENALRGLQ